MAKDTTVLDISWEATEEGSKLVVTLVAESRLTVGDIEAGLTHVIDSVTDETLKAHGLTRGSAGNG